MNVAGEQTLGWLLDEWLAHMDNVGNGPDRKLMSLAQTRLLETGQPWVLERLQSFIACWTDVLTELLDGMEDHTVECV